MNAPTHGFKPDDRVLYVPLHANGDLKHADVERGLVSSTNERFVFVLFYGKHGLSQQPQACYADTLVKQ